MVTPDVHTDFSGQMSYSDYLHLDTLLTAQNPLRFEFVSHKLFRLAVPFALIGMVLSSAFLSGFVYRLPLAAAIGIVALGALALVRAPLGVVSRVTDLALAFVLLNTAAMVAFFYFSVGRKQVWEESQSDELPFKCQVS